METVAQYVKAVKAVLPGKLKSVCHTMFRTDLNNAKNWVLCAKMATERGEYIFTMLDKEIKHSFLY
jgi:hypothetical protein